MRLLNAATGTEEDREPQAHKCGDAWFWNAELWIVENDVLIVPCAAIEGGERADVIAAGFKVAIEECSEAATQVCH